MKTRQNKVSARPGRLAAALIILLAPAGAARADMSWTARTTTTVLVNGQERTLQEETRQFRLKKNVLREDHLDSGVTRFFNFQNRTMVMVNLQTKFYAVLSFADLTRQINQERAALQRDLDNRERRLAGMDQQNRALAAAQLEAEREKLKLWSGTYSVSPSEERAEINSHPCRKHLGTSNGAAFQEIWVAEDIEIDADYSNFFARGMASLDRREHGHLTLVNGFPVRVVSRYGPVTVTVNHTDLSLDKVPVEAFILPRDLKPSPRLTNSP